MSTLLDGYSTRAKLAKDIKKSERTLERWARERFGPPITFVGETPYYHDESARKWLREQEQKPLKRR